MYEHRTYTKIMERVLKQVPSDVDKRQGSIIWDALALACAEIAQMYIELDNILKLTYAETSFDQWLDKRCAEMGVYRREATSAIRLGVMYGSNKQLMDIPIGSRFSIEMLNYRAAEKIDTGQYFMECEQTGKIGNHLYGKLIPIENISGLASSELTDVLIPGEERATDIELYNDYVEKVNSTPYGGNIADYKQKIKAIDGVGGCKIYPVWNGGGTVKATIIDSDFKCPSQTLVNIVQEIMDPEPNNQLGMGLAPIGHWVTIMPVDEKHIYIETKLTIKAGYEANQYLEDVTETARTYLMELTKDWEGEAYIIVRINQLEARLLSIEGVLDIEDTRLNGCASNIILEQDVIPIIGDVFLIE